MDSTAIIVKTEFFTKAFRNDFLTEQNKRSGDAEKAKLPPVYETNPMLRFTYSDGTVWARRAYEPDFYKYAHEYETFKKGGAVLGTGTALDELKGLTASEIATLKEMQIGFVEVLANMPEGQAVELGERYQQIRLYAQEFLRTRSDLEQVFSLKNELEKKEIELQRLRLGSIPESQISIGSQVNVQRKAPAVSVAGQEDTNDIVVVERRKK